MGIESSRQKRLAEIQEHKEAEEIDKTQTLTRISPIVDKNQQIRLLDGQVMAYLHQKNHKMLSNVCLNTHDSNAMRHKVKQQFCSYLRTSKQLVKLDLNLKLCSSRIFFNLSSSLKHQKSLRH